MYPFGIFIIEAQKNGEPEKNIGRLEKKMPQTNLQKAKVKAAKIGVSVKPSTVKYKKLDVYKSGEKIASIGDLRYSDFNLHGDSERRRRYKLRHEKHRHIKGSASYFADKILWWGQC